MKLFLVQLLELGSMALSYPEELAMYLQKEKSGNRQIGFLFSLIAISNATALFHMRSNYDRSFLVFIPLVTILCFILLIFWAFITGSVLDAIVRFYYPDKHVKSWNTIRIIALSLLPFVFSLPLAVPARFSSYPILFLFVSFLLLLIWHFIILLQSMRYHYELKTSFAVRLCLASIAIILIFPGVFGIFTLLEIVTLFG